MINYKKNSIWIFLLFLPLTQGWSQNSYTPSSDELRDQILNSFRNSPLKEVILEVKNLAFISGSTTPQKGTTSYLDTLAAVLKELPSSLCFEVSGHTDNTGSLATNLRYSEARAKAVYDRLLTIGILPDQISYKGYGPKKPVASNTTLAGRTQNRRVEITFLGLDTLQKNVITYVNGNVLEVPFLLLEDENKHILFIENDNEPLKEYSTEDISGIVLANGNLIEFHPLAKTEEKEVIEEKKTQTEEENVVSQTVIPVRKERKSFSLSVYGEGLYILEGLSPEWGSENNGLGLRQGFGGGLSFTKYLSKRVGVTLQGGYVQWEAEQRYINPNDRQVLSTAYYKLSSIAAQAGLRVYPSKNMYLQVLGGGQILRATFEYDNPASSGEFSVSPKKFNVITTGSLGYEIYIKQALIDISFHYNYIPDLDFIGFSSLHYPGVRLALGLGR